ncbi:MAG: hypothetical protein JRF63_08480, partial [Deltaproteobacteria bacterium]|nr:hypothetical protein [Deltaproteobacteria bacterium]
AELRDHTWQARFLGAVAEASFRCGEPQVIEGPDGFPYFQLLLPEPETAFQCYVLDKIQGDFLLEHGLGVAVNPDRGTPDWVFTYGDIVNYHLCGEFYSPMDENHDPSGCETIKKEEDVLVGQPAEDLLPAAARRAIRAHLIKLGLNDPKVLLMARNKDGKTINELVFNLTPDLFPTEEQYHAVMLSLGWFLPRHYTYVSLRGSDFVGDFQDL